MDWSTINFKQHLTLREKQNETYSISRLRPANEQLEVRAFGCLLEELLERCAGAEAAPATLAALWELQRRCVQPTVGARPLFAEVGHQLAQWQPATTTEEDREPGRK